MEWIEEHPKQVRFAALTTVLFVVLLAALVWAGGPAETPASAELDGWVVPAAAPLDGWVVPQITALSDGTAAPLDGWLVPRAVPSDGWLLEPRPVPLDGWVAG